MEEFNNVIKADNSVWAAHGLTAPLTVDELLAHPTAVQQAMNDLYDQGGDAQMSRSIILY
jgi:hypothetical protein